MLKIQNAATSYPWTSVANYDSEFRLKVMDDPSVSWASLDLEIFLERVLNPFNVQNKMVPVTVKRKEPLAPTMVNRYQLST